MTRPSNVLGTRSLSPCAMLVVNPDGTICGANAQAYLVLDYPAGTLVGLSLAWISPPSRHDLLSHVRATLEAGARRHVPSALCRGDGSIIDVSLTVNPCRHQTQSFLVIDIAPRGHATRSAAAHAATPTPATGFQAKPRAGSEPLGPAQPARDLHADASRRTQRVSMVPASASPSDEVCEQLSACLQLVSWLKSALADATTSELTSAQAVVAELSSLLEECRREVGAAELVARHPGAGTLRLVT